MVDLNDLLALDSPIRIPYEFKIDINTLVTVNHKITLEGISLSEQEEIATFHSDDEDERRSHRREQENFSEDLRRAANHLALVGLITRFQHWINKFVQELPSATKANHLSVARGIDVLNKALGVGPVSEKEFSELVDVRDSIIHQNSTTKEWEFRGDKRRVSPLFIGRQKTSEPDDKYLEVSEQQLKDATEKVIQQLTWYYELLPAKKP